jgi:hypothetical protein
MYVKVLSVMEIQKVGSLSLKQERKGKKYREVISSFKLGTGQIHLNLSACPYGIALFYMLSFG